MYNVMLIRLTGSTRYLNGVDRLHPVWPLNQISIAYNVLLEIPTKNRTRSCVSFRIIDSDFFKCQSPAAGIENGIGHEIWSDPIAFWIWLGLRLELRLEDRLRF